ncbi:MAG: radical SAM protein [Armatimonadota bacterium]|nr:radical SAM protein [Armatimonadota bacterium]
MNVLLVNTNRIRPPIAPIGLDYLADAVVEDGHGVRVLDLCFEDDVESAVLKQLRDFEPHVIGVTVRNTDDCYFTGAAFFLPDVKRVVEILRAHSDAPIVLGGVGFSVAPEAVLQFVGADFGVVGSAEDSFLLLLRSLQNGRDLSTVPNLVVNRKGLVRRTASRIFEAECVRSRSRMHVDNVRYFREGGQAGFETKRGCNKSCVYCADPVAKGRTLRLRPPKSVVSEIKALLARGIDHFHTCDSEFNIPADHAKDVCREIIDSGLGDRIRWYAYCSVTPFDREMALLLRRAGCVGIDFGVDSGVDRMLRNLGREYTVDDIEQAARLCREQGIVFMFDLLLGGPGETKETIRETIEVMRRINPDCVGVSTGVRVYQGTRMADLVCSLPDAVRESSLHGDVESSPLFLKPVFYISPEIGADIVAYTQTLIGDDPRFFIASTEASQSNYNYNENAVLIEAIRSGARGAYWDILRRLRCG